MNHSLQSKDRQIRVFISSTFRDMQEERDILIKKVFPQLRKMCEERAITWTEVDLRWGITDEQKAEGKVLPLCLEEIDRCRPYFISLLGERYGWVPDSIPTELLESQPWLKQHLQHSVTELEILHGVFSEEQMHGHAYFYFRDPRYVESVLAEKREDFTAENPESAEKLRKLKQKIRAARDEQVCGLREGYANPEQLGEWILEDFTALINTLYPKAQVPSPLDQEAARHDAYAQSRRLAFIGRDDLLRRLDEHASTGGKPLVLTGDSGCGKSALLAEWVARWRKDHPDDLIIQHYIGSTPDSADWQELVRRILGEFKRAFVIPDDLPVQPDALRSALNDWTVKAAGSRSVILVLDALNQLADDGAARQLGWLPVVFPTNFRVLVSTLPGESLDALRRCGYPELNVPLFAPAEVAPAALAYFKIFSKTPPKDIVAKLESTPAAYNALYLRAVLDELRQFGKHEELEAKAADYLSAPELPELFDRILTRWHDDFGRDQEHPDLVRRSLCLIACARFGLSEVELLDLLGKENKQGKDTPIPRRFWTPFYLAAENGLALRAGLLNFGHDYLRAAVLKRWLDDAKSVRAFRLHLVDYFDRIAEPTDRKLDELPWQLCVADEPERLRLCLTNLKMFDAFATEAFRWELVKYWAWLAKDSAPEAAYSEAVREWEGDVTSEAFLATLLGKLAMFYSMIGEHSSAVILLRRSVRMLENALGQEHDDTLVMMNNLAQSAAENAQFAEAELLLRKVLEVRERRLGADHPSTLKTKNNLADALRLRGHTVTMQTLFERVLREGGEAKGSGDLDASVAVKEFADILNRKPDKDAAESMLRSALDKSEREFGKDHATTLTLVNNLGLLLAQKCDLAAAEALYLHALEGRERILGRDHPDTLVTVFNLARLMVRLGDYDRARPLCRRASIGFDIALGADHSYSRMSREVLDDIS